MQEQEMEMKLRQEQVKQQYAMNMQQSMAYPPNMYGQPMSQQPGMYQAMPPQNQGIMPNQHQGPYMQQFNPAMAASQGQHPMLYQAGQPLPPQQQQPQLSTHPGQIPPIQANTGAPVAISEIPSTTATAGIDPHQSLNMQQSLGNSGPPQSQMHGNIAGVHSNIGAPGSGDIHLPGGAPFNMTSMASALSQQPSMANQYNPHQQQVMSIGQNPTSGVIQSFPHPEMQQALPQQGLTNAPQQQQQLHQPTNQAMIDPNVPQRPIEPQSLIFFD